MKRNNGAVRQSTRLPDTSATIFYLFICTFVFLFAACGIEDYPYIEPVPVGNVNRELNSRVVVRLPGDNTSFTNYIIYYKIYISDVDIPLPETGNFSTINATLNSDYLAIAPYIDSDSMSSSSVGTLFSQRKFYALELENRSIDNVLGGDSVHGSELTIYFSQNPGDIPTLSRTGFDGGEPLNLFRSNGGGAFRLLPEGNRYFINDSELYNPENILDTNINSDVTDKTGSADFSAHHTYAMMFILGSGLDVQTYNQIYSTPTFLHVMRLPDPSS